MESYYIKDLYMTTSERYLWQAKIRFSRKNTIVVQAPERSGKTFLCRDEAIDFINSMKAGSNILYFNPKEGEAARVTYAIQILLNRMNVHSNLTKNNVYIVEDQFRDTALFAPASVEAFAKALTSGYRFQEVVIDDAGTLNPTLLHTALLKAKVDDAKFLATGTGTPTGGNKKDIFFWLMNNPGVDAYRVHLPSPIYCTAPEFIKKGTESLADRIRKMLANSPVEVA